MLYSSDDGETPPPSPRTKRQLSAIDAFQVDQARRVRREIHKARHHVNEVYEELIPELKDELPYAGPSPSSKPSSRPPSSPRSTRVAHRGPRPSSSDVRLVNSRRSSPRSRPMSSRVLKFEPAPPTTSESRIHEQLGLWQAAAMKAASAHSSVYVWAAAAMNEHSADSEKDREEKGTTSVACVVLDVLMQHVCEDPELWKRLRARIFGAIFFDFDNERETTAVPAQVRGKTVPVSTVDLHNCKAIEQQLREVEAQNAVLREKLHERHKSIKSFSSMINERANRRASEAVRKSFKLWRGYASNAARHRKLFWNFASRCFSKRSLALHFEAWKVVVGDNKNKRSLRGMEEARKEAIHAQETLDAAVNAGKEATIRELQKSKNTLAEERDLRERQFTAFTYEVTNLSEENTTLKTTLDQVNARRVLWRALWRQVSRAHMPHMPNPYTAILGADSKSVAGSLKCFAHLLSARTKDDLERAAQHALEIDQQPSSGGNLAPTETDTVASGTDVMSTKSGDTESRKGTEETATNRQIESAKSKCVTELRERLEKLLVNWTNQVLVSFGVDRVLVSPQDDLSDGEIYAAVCAALQRGSLSEPLTREEERKYGLLGKKATLVQYAALLNSTLRGSSLQSSCYPIMAPLLGHCSYVSEQLSEETVLFAKTGCDEWPLWVLSTLFVGFAARQLELVEGIDSVGSTQAASLSGSDWSALSMFQMTEYKAVAATPTTGTGAKRRQSVAVRRKSLATTQSPAKTRRGSKDTQGSDPDAGSTRAPRKPGLPHTTKSSSKSGSIAASPSTTPRAKGIVGFDGELSLNESPRDVTVSGSGRGAKSTTRAPPLRLDATALASSHSRTPPLAAFTPSLTQTPQNASLEHHQSQTGEASMQSLSEPALAAPWSPPPQSSTLAFGKELKTSADDGDEDGFTSDESFSSSESDDGEGNAESQHRSRFDRLLGELSDLVGDRDEAAEQHALYSNHTSRRVQWLHTLKLVVAAVAGARCLDRKPKRTGIGLGRSQAVSASVRGIEAPTTATATLVEMKGDLDISNNGGSEGFCLPWATKQEGDSSPMD